MSEEKAEYKIPGRPSTIFRTVKNKDNPYVMIDRRPVDNPLLSYKAKGILIYLLSRPDGWEVNLEDLAKRSTDGLSAVKSGVKELKDAGHLKHAGTRNVLNGQFETVIWEVYEVPQVGNQLTGMPQVGVSPQVDYPQVENPSVGNLTQVVSNSNSKVTKTNISGDEYKKRIATATAQGIINSGKSHSKGVKDWPPDVLAWGETWMQLKGRESLTKGEFAKCIKDFRELQERGIELEQFEQGYKAATDVDRMTVSVPIGCWYVADEIRQGKRNPDGSKPDKHVKPRRPVVSADA